LGTTEIWPVVVHRDGKEVGSKARSSVTVLSSTEAIRDAITEFTREKALVRSDTIADSVLLDHLMHVSSMHGTILKDQAGLGDELNGLIARIQGLVNVRQHADSLLSDTNVAVPEQLAALKAYVESAEAVRDGHGPTKASDASRLKELDPDPVGTVRLAGVCPAKCNSDTRRDSLFHRGDNVGLMVRYLRGNSGRLTVEWRRDGVTQGTPNQYVAETRTSEGFRIWDQKNVGDTGKWEVRVLNAKRRLVFRHPFVVK
jgi:hypothetical protein